MQTPTWWRGWPNRVTTVRVVGSSVMLVATVTMMFAGPTAPLVITIAGIGLLCEALDGLDGWLARRLGQATPYGARFDMEVDSAMMLVLSTALLVAGIAGPWVLAIGGWRYGYVLAAQVFPALRRALPYRYSRKVVAATVALAQIGALALSLTPAPPLLLTAVLAVALAVLSWSFVRDIVWQTRGEAC